MTESQTLEDTLERAGTLPNVYRPIDPSRSFNRDEFLFHQDTLNDLTEYRAKLDKDPNDIKPREKLSRKIFGDPTYHVGLSEVDIRAHARAVHEQSLDNMARYAEHHFDKLFDGLEGESLQRLAFSVPLYLVKGDREHNALVNLLNEVREMEQIAQKEDIGKMREYLLRAVKEDKTLPNYMKEIITYLSRSEPVIARIFARANQARHAILSRVISTEDGKPNVSRLRSLIKTSLESAKTALRNEEDEGQIKDIWEDVVRPYYEKLAEVAYMDEDKKYQEEHSQLDEKNRREIGRRQLGMAA